MLKSHAVGLFVLSAGLLVGGGCALDAPHDNPLDPQSSQYTAKGALSGRVTLINFPAVGVASVRISTIPATHVVLTDSAGWYEFEDMPSGLYTVVAAKDVYTPDSTIVNVGPAQQQTANFSMNGFPRIVSTKILTRKIDQWWPNPAYFAEISASVTDPNGISDLDSAWFNVDSVSFPMVYSVTEKKFQLTLTSYQLPSNNLEWLVGKPLAVVARDQMKATGTSAPFYVTRMIEQEATPTSPASQDTTAASPVFQWSPPDVRFVYTYTLSVVYVYGGTTTTIWTLDNIGNHLLSTPYPSTLQKGNYFWTIAVVDEYGNYARSKESSFVVN